MKYVILLISVICISSCSNSKINTLEQRITTLEQEIEEIKQEKKDNSTFPNELVVENSYIKQFSDDEIIQIVKKDREYYCPNAKRKNFKIRKVDNNLYDVRFEHMSTEPNIVKEWTTTVYRIQILSNDKYRLVLQKGALC